MGIKNFLFLHGRNSVIIAALASLTACSTLKTRGDLKKPSVPTKQTEVSLPLAPSPALSGTSATDEDQQDVETNIPPIEPVKPPPQIPKIGLILGPGGALTYAHIGFLHELQKQKIPIHSVAGVEFAASMAALYSLKGFANDVEWQMFKLKDDEILKKNIIGGYSKVKDIGELSGFLTQAFSRSKAEDGRLPFACPALNMKKNQTYVMSRGAFAQMLPYCIAYPPLFRPYSANISGVREVKQTADYLRSQGANYIVLINVLGAPGANKGLAGENDSVESIFWNEIAAFYSRPLSGVDSVVSMNIEGYNLISFDKKREIMQKGSDQSVKLVEQLTRKLGL